MAVKPGHLNSVRKIYFKRQKWNSYGKKQSTLFFFFFKKLHVTSLEEKLRTYGHNWFEHICWRKTPKQLLKFIQKEDWRPLKRVLDDMNDETETDKPGLNLWWNIMMMMIFIHTLVSLVCNIFSCWPQQCLVLTRYRFPTNKWYTIQLCSI